MDKTDKIINAQYIMTCLEKSEKPVEYVYSALFGNGDICKDLVKCKFSQLVVSSGRITNLDKCDLLCELVLNYSEQDICKCRKSLALELIEGLWQSVSLSKASENHLKISVCYMYVENKMRLLITSKDKNQRSDADMLYERFYKGKSFTYPIEALAYDLHRALIKGKLPKNIIRTKTALENLAYEYCLNNEHFDVSGFNECAKLLLGKEQAQDICEIFRECFG